MAEFTPAMELLHELEGGYAPDDNGAGSVNYGLTQRFLQRIGEPATNIDIRNMTPEYAEGIYRRYFWDKYRCGDIRDQRLATAFFCTAVNIPADRAVKFLQEVVQSRPDGIVGPKTIEAINSCDACEAVVRFKDTVELQWYRMLAAQQPQRHGRYLRTWLGRLARL